MRIFTRCKPLSTVSSKQRCLTGAAEYTLQAVALSAGLLDFSSTGNKLRTTRRCARCPEYRWEAPIASERQGEVSFHCAPLVSLFLYIRKTIVALWRGTWRFIAARRDLALLADLDDRMLADIGLRRSDLHAAQCVPFWEDPTRVLTRRVDCRRATFELLAQTPVSTINDTDPATHAL
jgi:uncharacterized protein YjiS (DUF1127 family)